MLSMWYAWCVGAWCKRGRRSGDDDGDTGGTATGGGVYLCVCVREREGKREWRVCRVVRGKRSANVIQMRRK